LIRNKTNDLAAVNDLRPEMRDRLLGMLHAASREIQRRAEEITARQQQRIQQEMSQREMAMVNAALQHDQDKADQLLKRFDSLLADARQKLSDRSAQNAITAVSEAGQIAKGSLPSAQPAAIDGLHVARFQTALDDVMAVRVAAQKGFVDNLFQVEKSHIPTPDDPPIVYPDAETWKELTARRKEKYSSQELSKPSPAEKKIQEALKQPTQIEFVDTPLKDVVEYLKDLHHIEIQLDGPALKEAGVEESLGLEAVAG
jgi:hypothetical protein